MPAGRSWRRRSGPKAAPTVMPLSSTWPRPDRPRGARPGRRRPRSGLDAYAQARELPMAPRLSLDPAATVFQLGSILASVAPPAQRG